METKSLNTEIKAASEGRTIEGYAAAFGNIDGVGDRIIKGAFARTISNVGPPKKTIKLLWQHDKQKPIGYLTRLSEDDYGLGFEAVVSKTKQGEEALELIKDGVVDRMSIGYGVVKSAQAKDDKTVRELTELKLYEVSPVTFPANDAAIITGIKDMFDMSPKEFIKNLIETLGLTKAQEHVRLLESELKALEPSAPDSPHSTPLDVDSLTELTRLLTQTKELLDNATRRTKET